MKKTTVILALIMVLVLLFGSCAANRGQNETTVGSVTETTEPAGSEKPVINAGFLKGPTGMGAAYLYENNENGTAEAAYNILTEAAADVLQSKLINGELDIAALPVNVAAVLNAKTEGKIQMLAVNTLGVLYILSNSDEIKTLNDLDGKTILASGKGTTAEYALTYVLEKNGLTPGENITIEFASEHAETVTKAVAGGYDVVLLPEPFVTQLTMQNPDFKVAVDLTEEWEKLDGGLLTMGAVAVRKEFAEKNPEAVKAFLHDYENSVNRVLADKKEAAGLIEKFDIAKAAVAEKALPNCNITFMVGDEMKQNVSAYLSILADYNAQAVGGKLPGDDFYFIPAE